MFYTNEGMGAESPTAGYFYEFVDESRVKILSNKEEGEAG